MISKQSTEEEHMGDVKSDVHIRKYRTDQFGLCGAGYHWPNLVTFAGPTRAATCDKCLDMLEDQQQVAAAELRRQQAEKQRNG